MYCNGFAVNIFLSMVVIVGTVGRVLMQLVVAICMYCSGYAFKIHHVLGMKRHAMKQLGMDI